MLFRKGGPTFNSSNAPQVGATHIAIGGPKKGTRATLSAVVAPGNDTALLDFSSALLMPPAVGIAEARCTLTGPFAAAISTEILDGNRLRVRLQRPVPDDAEAAPTAVLCDVDQSQRSCAAH